uniref:Uncharacterized protein n=1 Tax=Anguilla anguilla TaxID=7936 RepID=A0A0E9Q934_ANGAN
MHFSTLMARLGRPVPVLLNDVCLSADPRSRQVRRLQGDFFKVGLVTGFQSR